jgi:hypothetical protein
MNSLKFILSTIIILIICFCAYSYSQEDQLRANITTIKISAYQKPDPIRIEFKEKASIKPFIKDRIILDTKE